MKTVLYRVINLEQNERLQKMEMVNEVNSSKDGTDTILNVAQSAINDFAESKKSVEIENLASEYIPYVIDKIFETSSDVVIYDGDNSLTGKYLDKLNRYIDHMRSITVYSENEKDPLFNEKINFIKVNTEAIRNFLDEDIKSAIIGDSIRFMIEKNKIKPSYSNFKNAIQNFFQHKEEVNSYNKSDVYQSVTNFGNTNKAKNLISVFDKIRVPE